MKKLLFVIVALTSFNSFSAITSTPSNVDISSSGIIGAFSSTTTAPSTIPTVIINDVNSADIATEDLVVLLEVAIEDGDEELAIAVEEIIEAREE